MENIRHILILEGNFKGRGTEAMMLVVGDTLKAAFGNSIYYVEPVNAT